MLEACQAKKQAGIMSKRARREQANPRRLLRPHTAHVLNPTTTGVIHVNGYVRLHLDIRELSLTFGDDYAQEEKPFMPRDVWQN